MAPTTDQPTLGLAASEVAKNQAAKKHRHNMNRRERQNAKRRVMRQAKAAQRDALLAQIPDVPDTPQEGASQHPLPSSYHYDNRAARVSYQPPAPHRMAQYLNQAHVPRIAPLGPPESPALQPYTYRYSNVPPPYHPQPDYFVNHQSPSSFETPYPRVNARIQEDSTQSITSSNTPQMLEALGERIFLPLPAPLPRLSPITSTATHQYPVPTGNHRSVPNPSKAKKVEIIDLTVKDENEDDEDEKDDKVMLHGGQAEGVVEDESGDGSDDEDDGEGGVPLMTQWASQSGQRL